MSSNENSKEMTDSSLIKNENNEDIQDANETTSSFKLHKKPMVTGVLPKDALYYNMNHPKRGIAIILNHEYFDIPTLKSRSGTNADSKNLEKTFKLLGFDVQVHKDLTTQGVFKTLKEAATYNYKDCDCLVVSVLSHGELGILYSKDTPYRVEDIWRPFIGSKCLSLVGKPKIFFIQACQGDQLDGGIHATQSDGSKSYTIPECADFLMIYSTIPGYYSWRNTTNGSWFIQSLSKQLMLNAYNYDILTLLTLVLQNVAFDYESNSPSIPQMDKQKQIPCITSMLTRLLQFTPKKK